MGQNLFETDPHVQIAARAGLKTVAEVLEMDRTEERADRQPIFILGFPRSGTTLLQRILNSYEDVLIWGEHVGFLRDVASAYFRVWRNQDFFKSTVSLDQALQDPGSLTPWPAWMNWIAQDDWKALYRRFLESIFAPGGLPGKRFWGWKEVHYSGAGEDRTLPFLAEIYPDARYVFLVRDGFNNLASFSILPERRNVVAWKHEGCDRWRDTIRSFRNWHGSGRLHSFWIRYEDLIQGRGEILRLVEHMGKRFGEDQHTILRAESGRVSSFGSESYNDRWKQLSTFRQGVAMACFASLNRELGYENPRVPLPALLAGRAAAPVLTFAHLVSRVLPRIRAALGNGGAVATTPRA